MRGSSLLALLVLASCARAQPEARSASPLHDASADEQEIRHALADWVAAYNAGDYARAASVWAPDLVGWYPGAPDDTYAEEQAAAKRPPPPEPRSQFALTINEVMVSGDMAVVRDTWTESRGDRSSTFRSFEVWRRQPDGHWRIARWIDAVPPK